jgi:hypothetical protein
MGDETGPAARAFLRVSRAKITTPRIRREAGDAFLQLADSLGAEPLEEKASPRPLARPWSELLPMVRSEGKRESAFRQAVRSAAAVLEEAQRKATPRTFIFYVPGDEVVDRDAEIEQWQREAAVLQYRVQEARADLEEVQRSGKDEPAFWRAAAAALTYHLMVRERFFEEYNRSLAEVRRGDLPALHQKTDNGWRLVVRWKVTPGSAPADGTVGDAFRSLAKHYPGTMWAAIAWQERRSPEGLAWMADRENSKPPARVKGRTREPPAPLRLRRQANNSRIGAASSTNIIGRPSPRTYC